MQHEITVPGNLLSKDGTVTEAGYSTHNVLHYNRKSIHAAPWRIKEWDFYQISNDRFCIQFTIGHASYVGSVAITVLDLEKGRKLSDMKLLLLPFNKLHLPSSAEEGDVAYKTKGFEMSFTQGENSRRLYCKIDDPKMTSVDVDITLSQPDKSSLVIATPYRENPHAFYYNHKINCMPAAGRAIVGGIEYSINPDNTFGLLDWGRGVWLFKNEWFWSNGSQIIDGRRFGFNLGYGFGDTSAATENMLFYDGTCHKLENVKFNIPNDDYSKPWTFTSSDNRFEMDFVPVYDNYTETKMLVINNNCHQVFGRFTGKAVLDDGRVINVKNLMAFAEHAVNRW
jgi:hypothetical protein